MIDNVDEINNEIYQNTKSLQYIDVLPDLGEKTHKISNTFDENFLQKYNLIKTEKMIIENVKKYFSEIYYEYDLNYNINKIESWMTSFCRNQYSISHVHGTSNVSGVYYYKSNGEDGNIIFQNFDSLSFSKCFVHYRQSWIHKPCVGKILLFPSCILHYVTQNNTDTERNSLSFNIFLK